MADGDLIKMLVKADVNKCAITTSTFSSTSLNFSAARLLFICRLTISQRVF